MKLKKTYSLDSFTAGHFFDDLSEKDSFYCKKFFGGLSIYVFGKMVAFLCEHPGDKKWRGKKYDNDLWNGCLIPSSYGAHISLSKKIKGISVHPVIRKWLYLPVESNYFEQSMLQLVEMIQKKDSLVGVEPEVKAKKSHSRKKTPFSNKISDMRNLGPAVEKDLNAAGVYSAEEVIELGPEKVFFKMLEGRMKIGRSARCCNALYLYSFYGAIHNIDWRAIPAQKKIEFKTLTKKLRRTGKYGK